MRKTVGVLGGMGPLATVDLFAKIVQCTPAAVDQDHLRIIVDNNPQIPPRVEAILHGAESPLPGMARSARLLEEAGADFIVMPCNTAHYWIRELRQAVRVPVLNMIDAAAAHIAQRQGAAAGPTLLLATAATIRTGLYQKAFAVHNLALVMPNDAEQKALDTAVRQVKAGLVADNPYLGELNAMVGRFAAAGTQAMLAGCTEVPLLFPFLGGPEKFDATAILAQAVVETALA
ncbi:MAG: amino acid racemase [Sporomusaceae bacterium]|nr:amino acid racemase [Sporomusaceae bacterium]